MFFYHAGKSARRGLTKTVTIRGEEHSVMQAINRQVAHYSYHVGQIVFLGAALCGRKLEIADHSEKANLQEFNADVAAGKKSQR